jgi:hypothetical protein
MFGLIFEAALLAAKTKRGRRLAILGLVGAWRLASSERALAAYAGTWRMSRRAAVGAATTGRRAGVGAAKSAARRMGR